MAGCQEMGDGAWSVSGTEYVGDAAGKDDNESDGLTHGVAVISNSLWESEWCKETHGWADNDGR